MGMISRPFGVTVAGGQSQALNVAARFVYVDSMALGGELWLVGDGVEVRLIVGRQVDLSGVETSVRLENRSGSSVDCVLIFGNIRVSDHAIVGTVGVIDGTVEAVKNGLSYMCTGWQPAVASEYSNIQLWNPVGSGRLLVVSMLSGRQGNGLAAVGTIGFFRSVAPLGTDVVALGRGAIMSNDLIETVNDSGALLLSGSQVGSSSQSSMFRLSQPLGVDYEDQHDVKHPILLREGCGLTIQTGGVNQSTRGTFQFSSEVL